MQLVFASVAKEEETSGGEICLHACESAVLTHVTNIYLLPSSQHRDIKPQNVLLNSKTSEVKLCGTMHR